MTIMIKPSLKDLPKIREILSQWHEEEKVEIFANAVIEELGHPTPTCAQTWLLQESENIIGVAQLTVVPESEDSCKIEYLHIDGDHQGKGYGKTLLLEVEHLVKESNRHILYAVTNADKLCPAFLFYQKMGYTFVENQKDALGKDVAVHQKEIG